MGLFSKKEICPICGKKIKGDVLVKIKDNIPLCKDCSAMVNMDAEMIAKQTVEAMRAHLKYREQNLEKYENFQVINEAKAGTSVMRVDEAQKIWYCTRNRKDKNPPIFTYDEIIGYQYLEDGLPVQEEEEKKGVFGSLFGEKKEPVMLHSMKVHIDLDNPYTRHMDVEAVAMNDEVKTGSLVYKSNRRALTKILDILDGMTGQARGGSGFVGAEAEPQTYAEPQTDAGLDFSNTCEEPDGAPFGGSDGAPFGGSDGAPFGGSDGMPLGGADSDMEA